MAENSNLCLTTKDFEELTELIDKVDDKFPYFYLLRYNCVMKTLEKNELGDVDVQIGFFDNDGEDQLWKDLTIEIKEKTKILAGHKSKMDDNERFNTAVSDLEKAGRLFDEAIQHQDLYKDDAKLAFPTPTTSFHFLIRGCSREGTDEEEANDYEMSIKLNRYNFFAFRYRAGTYRRLADSKRAMSDLESVLELLPTDPGSIGNRANLHMRRGQFNDAIDGYTDVISICPTGIKGFLNRGLAYYAISEFKKAINDFESVAAIDSALGVGLVPFWKACIEKKKGNSRKAIEGFSACIRIGYRLEICHRKRGKLYLLLEMYEQAIVDFTRAFEQSADSFFGIFRNPIYLTMREVCVELLKGKIMKM